MNSVDSILGILVISSIVMLFISKQLVRNQASIAFEKKEFISNELVDSVYRPLLTKGAVQATVKSYRNADFTYVRENLCKIKKATLIFWGGNDRIHARWMMEEMLKKIEGSEMIVFDTAGHMPHEEDAEVFNKKALLFLQQSGR